MKFKLEQLSEGGQILFINPGKTQLADAIRKRLESYHYAVESVSSIPQHLSAISYIFIFNTKLTARDIAHLYHAQKKTVAIYSEGATHFTSLSQLIKTTHSQYIKTIHIAHDTANKETVEQVLWFMFSASNQQALALELHGVEKPQKPRPKKTNILPRLSRRKRIVLCVMALIIIEFFFVLPLVTTAYFIKQSLQTLPHDATKTQAQIAQARYTFRITEKSYALSRPLLSFFFLALVPDHIISVEESAIETIEASLALRENGRHVLPLILNTQKSPAQSRETRTRVALLKRQSNTIRENVSLLSSQIDALPVFPFYSSEKLNTRIAELRKTADTLSQLTNKLDTLMGTSTEKVYVIFFYNNMELRPGGGFIGSFALARFSNYTLNELKVYDVYDADGQLKAHIEPPQALRAYMGQPNWFLRDSNFSADFTQNVKTAEFFLEKEIGATNFDGAIGITTTGISYLLEAFGSLYLPDLNETITKDNFYIKTQLQAEKNFFPGSAQKKNFLSSLIRSMIVSVEDASLETAGSAFKQALQEKHIVLYFKDPEVEKIIEGAGWDGKIRLPRCVLTSKNCIVNTIIPVDANLGVNKANFFVSRLMKIATHLQPDGSTHHLFTTIFTNDSPPGVFPGGAYKNYYQVYVPNTSIIQSVTVDGSLADWRTRSEGAFTVISVFLTVPEQKTNHVEITYDLPKTEGGNGTYQLSIQKQIGVENDEISFEFHIPPSIRVIEKNFSGLEKNGVLVYNTHLSEDKIVLLQFVRR